MFEFFALCAAVFGAAAALGFIADHMPSTPSPADFQGDDDLD